MGFANDILVPHPALPYPPVYTFTAAVTWGCERALALCFRLDAFVDELRIPALGPTRRADDLWQHTCFEVFVGFPTRKRYLELNFSPSGAWAAYDFASYRKRSSATVIAAPEIYTRIDVDSVELEATIAIDRWLGKPPPLLHVGLAAVLEDAEGALSYWALHHAGDKPDFHDPQTFTLQVSG